MKKEVVIFKVGVNPAENVKLIERIKDNGVIEELRVRFNPGCENTLLINPYVSHKIRKREDLVTFNEGGDQSIYGDNDYFIYPIYLPVEYDDDLIVEGLNTDQINEHVLSVDIVISYEGAYN